jgi:hypothetical protein
MSPQDLTLKVLNALAKKVASTPTPELCEAYLKVLDRVQSPERLARIEAEVKILVDSLNNMDLHIQALERGDILG